MPHICVNTTLIFFRDYTGCDVVSSLRSCRTSSVSTWTRMMYNGRPAQGDTGVYLRMCQWHILVEFQMFTAPNNLGGPPRGFAHLLHRRWGVVRSVGGSHVCVRQSNNHVSCFNMSPGLNLFTATVRARDHFCSWFNACKTHYTGNEANLCRLNKKFEPEQHHCLG